MADYANDLVERERTALIEARVHYEGQSADMCAECGLLISSDRQIAVPGCETCTKCAAYFEARDRLERLR